MRNIEKVIESLKLLLSTFDDKDEFIEVRKLRNFLD